MADFKQVGNLAFYEGWRPNYVYFSSLLDYANVMSDGHHGGWNPDLAMQIASHAVNDAKQHLNPGQMSEAESVAHFTEKFEQIIQFLQSAIMFEQRNESAYIQELYDQLQNTFTAKERKEIKALMQLDKLLAKAKESPSIEYDQINVLINVLMQGFSNMHTVLNYEEQRVKKMDDKLKEFIHSRGNQAAGLKRSANESTQKQLDAAARAEERLQRKILVEYATTGQLTRKEGDKYVIFGAATLEREIPQAIDRVFSDWANNMIEKLISDRKFVNKLRLKLNKKFNKDSYPVDGNFLWLEDEFQKDTIQAIIALGLKDLETAISKEISDGLVKSVKSKLLSTAENDIFNQVHSYKIEGLDTKFGRIVKQPELIREVHNLADLEQRNATELYEAMRRLIEAEKDQTNKGGKHSRSYLIQAMEGNKSKIDENSLIQTENIISLIETLEKLQKKYEDARKAWHRAKKKADNELIKTPKELKLSKNMSVKLEVKNGELQIERGSLLDLIKNDNRFGSFDFSKFNPQSLKTAIQTLKRKASINLKNSIISSLRNAKFEMPQSQLTAMVTRELRSVKININGPTLAELMTGIYFKGNATHAIVDWNKYKGKNDSVQILIASSKAMHKLQLSKFYETFLKEDPKIQDYEKAVYEAQENLALAYQKAIDSEVQKLTSDNDMQKYSKMIGIMDADLEEAKKNDKKLAQADEELKKATEELLGAYKSAYRRRSSSQEVEGISPELFEQIGRDCLNTIQRAFYVSTTVKSANDYVNDYGFKGGTLGSDLDAQLARLNDIFESAGVPIDQDDFDWLRSAILNCFPGSAVGEKNKGLIESYLGSLAAFALFDEGAAEADIVDTFKDTLARAIRNNETRKIVHLYVVDGIYVKGSAVLQRVLDSLQGDVMQNIQQIPSLMRRGAGVTIINKASEDMIPNRPWKKHLENQDTKAWETVSSKVTDTVSIKILFLAGLLDIIHNINATLNKAEALM